MSNLKLHEIVLTGTKLLDTATFYDIYDDYKRNKQRVPIFLYSFNLVDKITAELVQDNLALKLINRCTGEEGKFKLGEFVLEKYLYERNIFELKDIKSEDIEVSIRTHFIDISIQGELKELLQFCQSKINELFDDFVEYIFPFLQRVDLVIYLSSQHEDITSQVFIDVIDDFRYENHIKDDDLIRKFKEIVILTARELLHTDPLSKISTDIFKSLYLKLVAAYNKSSDKIFLNNEMADEIYEIYFHKYIENEFEDEVIENFMTNVCIDSKYYSRFNFDHDKVAIETIDLWKIIGNRYCDKYIEGDSFKNLKLENLYIGQSFGNNGSRNVLDRIGTSHEKLQRILSTEKELNISKELAILFFTISPKNHLLIDSYGTTAVEAMKQLIEEHGNLSNNAIVDLAEIGLITYFKPRLNSQHVGDDFKIVNSKKIQDIIDNFDGININMSFERVNWLIKSSGDGKDYSSETPCLQIRFKNKVSFNQIKNFQDIFEDLIESNF